MRVEKKTILVLFIVAVAGVAFAVFMLGRPVSDKTEKINDTPEQQVASAVGAMRWPMFRGGQNLLGRASGALADSMEVVWKFKTNSDIKSSPVIDEGLVFIGSSDANVYAIDIQKGRQVWAYRTAGAVEAAPCVVDRLVCVGSSDTYLYGLNAKDGSLRWQYKTDAKILGAANWSHSPDGRDTWILAGSYDGKLHCVDSATGQVVWTYETDNYVNGSPAVGEGIAVVGGCDAMIHVVSLANGSEVAQIDTGSFIAASAAIFEKRAYVGNYDGIFLCADLAAREIVWKYEQGDSPYFSSPAIGKDVVVGQSSPLCQSK
ncbi:MAG: outer membrane protein assembly factor BamB family protein [Planctomycetota bacterium]